MEAEGRDGFKKHLLRPTWVELDLDALDHNIKAVKKMIAPQKLVGVLKGNACGLGVAQCGLAMDRAGVDMVAVVNPAEVTLLRKQGVKCPIILYPGFGKEQLDEVVNLGAILSISDHHMADAIIESVERAGHGPLQVILKVDTGLGRLGEDYESAVDLALRIAKTPGLKLVGVHSHMGAKGEKVQVQYDRLATVAEAIESHGIPLPITMIDSSPYVSSSPTTRLTAIDPGRLLFGLKVPAEDPGPTQLVKPVFMALKTQIIQLKTPHKDDPHSSYPDVKRYGVVPFGWYDLTLPDVCLKTGVVVSGKKTEFLTRPSTQHSVIDLSDIPEAAVGDVVTIIARDGDGQNDLASFAAAGNMLENEITRRFSTQMSYVYFRHGNPAVVTTPLGDRVVE